MPFGFAGYLHSGSLYGNMRPRNAWCVDKLPDSACCLGFIFILGGYCGDFCAWGGFVIGIVFAFSLDISLCMFAANFGQLDAAACFMMLGVHMWSEFLGVGGTTIG